MTAYELMLETNRRLIGGEEIPEEEKAAIADWLLRAANIPERPYRFGTEPTNKAWKPLFFFPPRNDGKKLKTVSGQTPKTNILNDNMYELEILRLLCLFAPNSPVVGDMAAQTIGRLKAACFGFHGCYTGECFDSALVVLRFLTAAAPDETEWMEKIITMYNNHHADKKRVKAVENYYKLIQKEMDRQ